MLTVTAGAASIRFMRYRITTLGCRVNHAETRELESVLLARGFVRARDAAPADLEIVHTCSVTRAAAAKSRAAIRGARRRMDGQHLSLDRNGPEPLSRIPAFSSSPRIVVTGCYGSTDPAEAARLAGGPDRVIRHESDDGTTLADRFARRVDQWLATRGAPRSLRTPAPDCSRHAIRPLPVVTPRPEAGAHVRAELKIQDGCDAGCTFCIIPRIRPTLRSKTIPDAVAEATRLVELGHREIVLTGIFLGAYGHETALRRKQRSRRATPLADLLDAVAQVPGLVRLRLSSMEPGDVSGPLLDAMVANRPVVVPHLHLPLQSGSDAVLRRMNRQYRVGAYLEMIDRVNAALTTRDGLPPAITTDVMCGFPGETDADFERTVAVARRVGYLHMHLFTYSARRGTAAARWRDAFVPAPVARARFRRLTDLECDPEDGLSIRYRRRLVGRTVRVVLEGPAAGRPGVMTGRCDHYALVSVRTDRPRGAVMEAVVTAVTRMGTAARPPEALLSLPVLV